MAVTFTNLWPREVEFDPDYYLNTHMPLTARLLGPQVLVKWQLWKLPDDSPFSHEAAVTWASLDARAAALLTPDGQRCKDDAAKCALKPGLVLLRRELGAGSAA